MWHQRTRIAILKAPAKIREWRLDPVKFVRECLHAEPDPWQLDVLKLAGEPGRKRIGFPQN